MLISHLTAKSEELKSPSLLVTFEPQPREYFRGAVVPARLTRFREKIAILLDSDIDRVLCIPFNEQTRSISADAVIDSFLVGMLDLKYIVVGDDFRFGKNALGDYSMLKSAGDRYGFGVSHMGTLVFDHERVSSTRIREALEEGDFELVEKLLGREYFMMGTVVRGRQLGRTIGVPTANIRLQRYRSALEGIFAVTVSGLEREYQGSAYIGTRPTIAGTEPLLEVHLFGLDRDIYGARLKVTFHKKFRDDREFPDLNELKQQMYQDMVEIRNWFEKRNSTATS